MITVTTEKLPAPIGPYSAAKISNGLLFVSGQTGSDPVRGGLAGDDISSQTEQVMKNIAVILEAAGSSFEKVVKTTCFLADIGDFAEFNRIYAQYFTGKPARSCFAVKSLPLNALVEVELIAEV